MKFAWIVVAAGCWSAAPAPHGPPKSPDGLVITQHGWGPINAATVATLTNLRALFPAYRIVPANDPQLEYDIYDGKQKLGFVVLNDDASVFNVHATSNRVRVEDRAWRAGESFQDSKVLSRCECWGSNPTCYKIGEHVAINFDRPCLEDGDDARVLRVLDGLVVQRVIWSVEPLGLTGIPADDTTDSADPDSP
ncbi:MAG TPA: hypothetical protein VFQ65_13725 [Kofleriaceae bacterium]|nr:hypothetical protein [Kofleriaceae bacterium]